MKIAHIAPPWIAIPPKNYGGTESVLSNLVEEQVAQGHDVTLFAPDDARVSAKVVSFFPLSLIDSEVPWSAHLKAYYHIYKSVEYIRQHDFDIVHTHLSSAADMYLFPLTTDLGKPLVMTLHSRFPFDRVGSWTGDADQCYMEWMSTVPVVAISERARAEVPYKLNFVGTVHHGLPMKRYQPAIKAVEDHFVWLGRIFPEKGTHLAIKAAKMAGVKLVIAGTVDRHMPDSVHYFEDAIKPQIDHQQITYIGPVNMKQKLDLLSGARGLLNPIEWEEPFGMVMVEAMAVGCPVISYTRGSAPEIVVHRKSGFLVHDLAEMVQYMQKIGELDRGAVRTHIERNFSARTMVEKYVNIYKKVVASWIQKRVPVAVTTKVRPVLTPPAIRTVEPVVVPKHPSPLAAMPAVEVEPEALS